MSDLVKRLRAGKRVLTSSGPVHYSETDPLRLKAADRIERLEAALKYGFDLYGYDGPDGYWPIEMRREFDRLARDALKDDAL